MDAEERQRRARQEARRQERAARRAQLERELAEEERRHRESLEVRMTPPLLHSLEIEPLFVRLVRPTLGFCPLPLVVSIYLCFS